MSTIQAFSAQQLHDLTFELQVERARLKRAIEASEHARRAGGADSDAVAMQSDIEARHDAVEAALARIEDGTYGHCGDCGQQIPFGRLIVMPEATHCVGCKA